VQISMALPAGYSRDVSAAQLLFHASLHLKRPGASKASRSLCAHEACRVAFAYIGHVCACFIALNFAGGCDARARAYS
jgi:hypothetical protein